MSPYVRTVKTASGATAVQIVHSNRRGSREIEHIGSAHTPEEVEVLKAVARQRLHANQDTLDLGDGRPGDEEAPIVSTRAKHLWEALCPAYEVLGFDQACGRDEVFKQLVLARMIEPTSKLDSIRVLDEIGIAAAVVSDDQPAAAGLCDRPEWRQRLAAACAAHVGLGPATLVLYDVTTLYFETDDGDGFREPGFSKERRLEPQITVGLFTDARGFPLMVHAFEGNTAETKTILPVIQAFAAAHRLAEVTVVADAGMLSEANLAAIEDAGLRFIVGARIPEVPYQVAEWRSTTPGRADPDGQVFTQPWVMGPKADPRSRTIFYQYRADRARRTLNGIDQQIAKAEKAVAGQAAVKRNRFVQLTGATKSINRDLEAKARALAGLKGYITNLRSPDRRVRDRRLPPAVADREELPDVQARPARPADLPPQTRLDRGPPHHRVRRPRRQPAGSNARPAGAIKKFVKTLRRYRTIAIQTGDHILHAGTPLDDDHPRRPQRRQDRSRWTLI